jgi:hypothetical protein
MFIMAIKGTVMGRKKKQVVTYGYGDIVRICALNMLGSDAEIESHFGKKVIYFHLDHYKKTIDDLIHDVVDYYSRMVSGILESLG